MRTRLCLSALVIYSTILTAAVAAEPVRITEFMAVNDGPLTDEDGNNSDWIEIHNGGTNVVNLNGWGLTDRFPTVNPWRFPSTNLGPNQYLIVFASGNNRRVPGAPLHTDFRLDGGGEYLALLEPGGTNVASSFGLRYPDQASGVSYGIPLEQTVSTLIGSGVLARVLVPQDDSLGASWMMPGFEDSAWLNLPTGVGYEADGEVPFVPMAIANSVTEFSGVQGHENWHYGHWNKAGDADGVYGDADFIPFPNAGEPFGPQNFWTGLEWDWFNGDPPFTQLTAEGGHPSGGAGGGPLPEHWAIRRYVSEVEGPIRITGRLTHTSDWVRVTATGAAGSGVLYVYLTGLGEGYLDDMTLVVGDEPGMGSNLIANGDFENPTLQPNWTVSANLAGSSVTTVARHGGNRSLRLVSSAGGSSQSSAVWQSVAGVTAGQTYTLSYWYLPATNSSPLVVRFSGSWIETTPEYCGDGVVARILVDGSEVFQQRALVSSLDYAVTVPTLAGSKVDFVIDPGPAGDAECDGATFTAAIQTADPIITTVADTAADWSLTGTQGDRNWFYGYFNAGTNAAPIYRATNFTAFPRDGGPPSTNNFWDGEKWEWFNGRPPVDRVEQYWMTPNGTNNGPIHWVIKRWVSEVSGSISIDWSAWKEFPDQNNSGGGGVTMRIFHNGVQRDVSVVAGGNVTGVRRTVNLSGVAVGDTIDIAVDPANAADGRPHDDTDRTFVKMSIRGAPGLASQITSDLRSAMQGSNATAFIRIPFNVENPAAFSSLKLRMKYDDGFAAYLNGDEVARDNAPPALEWLSVAPASRPDSDANSFVEFDISTESLRPGENVLAIHGLNRSAIDGDFLILPELLAATSTLLPGSARYFMIPTPGAVNGAGNTNLGPLITSASHAPNVPRDDEALWVTASVSETFNPVATVRLIYRVMYSNEVNAAMFDDGQHGDGAAGDGVWGASIPASAGNPGQMVRYYVFATDSVGGRSRFPAFLDPQNSPEYQGTVVFNPTLTNGLPVMHFFVQNQVAATNFSGTRGSIFWDEEFFDNIRVSGHGQTTWSVFPKRSMDFNLNTGFKLRWKRGEERVKAFDLLTTAADKAYMRMTLAFEAYRDAGVPTHYAFPVRLEQNNAFHSIMTFVEQANDEMLQRNGLDPEGALYKIYFPLTNAYSGTKKVTRQTEPNDDLQALIDGLRPSGTPRRNYLFDNVDVAEVVNWMATIEFVQNEDCCFKNYYVYRDTRGSGEWQMLPWDHDLTFGRTFVAWAMCGAFRCGGYYDTNIYATNLYSNEMRAGANGVNFLSGGGVTPMVHAIFSFPDTQEMFYRRWSSIQEQLLQPQNTHPVLLRMERRIDELVTQMAVDSALDFAKWLPLNPPAFSTNETFATGVSRLKNQYLTPRRNWIFNQLTYASGGPYLGPQPTNAAIGIAAVEPNPSGDQAREYVLFTNANTFPVDMSRWQLTGAVSHVFKPGTVIPARGSLYLSPDVKAFRARPSGPRGGQGLFVQGNYKGQLSAWGESLSLVDTKGRLVNTTNYSGAPSPAQRYLRITEIMYAPPAPPPGLSTNVEEFEYVELRNISADTTLDLTGIKLTRGIEFKFASSGPVTSLAPGASTLLVRSIPAFTSRYGGGLSVAGQWIGQLDNQGETLRLEDANGEKILEFDYEPDWYPITDGGGFSLVIVDEAADWDTWGFKTSWRASGAEYGSPGQPNVPAQPIAPILVNEVLTRTDLPLLDTVELFNPTPNPVNLRGWFLSDDFGTPKKFRVNTDVFIPAGGYVLFDEDDFNLPPSAATSFAFSSLGDEVYLFSGDAQTNLTGYFHGFAFGAAENGVSFGRHLNSQGEEHLVAQTAFTPNAANAGPKTGPIVVSEIMYHPPELPGGEEDVLAEFIELRNISAAAISLFDPGVPANTWQLRNAVEFIFPANVVVPAGGEVVVVAFDPNDVSAAAAFRNRYGIAPSIPLFGPFDGQLNNSGDSVELYKPTTPEIGGIPYVLVDWVDYAEAAPWPEGADGSGPALRRVALAGYGNDPANWIAAAPTPGQVPIGTAAPVIVTQPADRDAIASQSASFSVAAAGNAPLRYQWRFNGDDLPDATNTTLLLGNLQLNQAGDYSVAVFNPGGMTISSNAALRVLLGAFVTTPPLNVTLRGSTNVADYGFTTNNATFTVNAIGTGLLRYQWRFNGVDIPGRTGTSLTVTNVDLSNDGLYQVAITDEVGTIVSAPVRLTVLLNPIVVIPPPAVAVVTGATFRVSVAVTGNPVPFGFEWRAGGGVLLTSNTVASRTAFSTFTAPSTLVTNQVWRVIVRNLAQPQAVAAFGAFQVSTFADSDGDGLPDIWENTFGAGDRLADSDGDGMLNWQEYLAGTNPTNALSYLRVDAGAAGHGAVVSFNAVSNRTYTVEFSDDLDPGAWRKLADLPARNVNRVETVLDSAGGTNRFYRLATPQQP